MTLNWAISGAYIHTIPRVFREKWRFVTLSFASLYLLYLIGMIYSIDLEYGWFDLEVKLSLLIFPVVFATSELSPFSQRRLRMILGSFVAGCIVGSLLLLGHSWLIKVPSGVPNPFYYTNLSWYFHTSYLAMYYSFAIGIVLYYLAIESLWMRWKALLFASIIIYLEVLLFLLSSKAGLITLIITELLFIALLVSRRVRFPYISLATAVLIIVFVSFSQIFPVVFKRISRADAMINSSQTLQSSQNDGTVARMEIWKISVGLIQKNFLFGVGTGDVKDVLIETYQKQELDPLVHQKLNAHNQYLQTFLALGFIGFCLLMTTLFVPALASLKRKNYILTLVILILAVNMLFESMLETQAGVVFFAFFSILLFSTDPPPKIAES